MSPSQQIPVLELPDDVILTQYGEAPPAGDGFRDYLRPDIGETELSLLWGDMDADAASLLVTKTLREYRICRKTFAGYLREAGFTVLHSPNRANRLHVSVYAPTLSSGQPAEWGPALAKTFNDCFTVN